MLLNGLDNSQRIACLFFFGDLDPYVIHGFLGPPELVPKSFDRFYRVRERHQQTDTHTDRQTDHARYTPSIAIARILCNE